MTGAAARRTASTALPLWAGLVGGASVGAGSVTVAAGWAVAPGAVARGGVGGLPDSTGVSDVTVAATAPPSSATASSTPSSSPLPVATVVGIAGRTVSGGAARYSS